MENRLGTFTCEVCKGTFPKAWTDEESIAEMKQYYGDLPEDERSIICEVCYVEVRKFIRENILN